MRNPIVGVNGNRFQKDIMMPNINGSISIERAAKYLRTEAKTQIETSIPLRLIGSASVLSYGGRSITEQNPAAEALRKLTEPHIEAKKSSLNQDELLIFRLGHKELQEGNKGAKKKSAAKTNLSEALNALLAAHPWKLGGAANF